MIIIYCDKLVDQIAMPYVLWSTHYLISIYWVCALCHIRILYLDY